MTLLRELENFDPDIVKNSELTISVGSARRPNAEGSPPRLPSPLAPSRMPGQMTVWKVMLSLPMK